MGVLHACGPGESARGRLSSGEAALPLPRQAPLAAGGASVLQAGDLPRFTRDQHMGQGHGGVGK